jgi:hypothetical protein
MKKRFVRIIISISLILSLFSCGGGSSAPEDTAAGNGSNNNTNLPEPPTTNSKHVLGPDFGKDLSLYHAELVMKVLRLFRFAENTFAGIRPGEIIPHFSVKFDWVTGAPQEIFSGVTGICQSNGDVRGTRTITWDNGATDIPNTYSSTRVYSDCVQHGLSFSDFNLFDGTFSQSGTNTTDGYPHGVQGGFMQADRFKITDLDEQVSVTFNGSFNFSKELNKPYTHERSALDFSFREENDSRANSGTYVEEVGIYEGSILFEQLTIVGQNGSSFINGVKEADFKITVKNNNHDTIALSVVTVPPQTDDVFYSLQISRAEASPPPGTTSHSIRIDRLNKTGDYVYDVSIDFNGNGVIEESGVYPDEFHDGEALNRDRWGYLDGL